MKYYRVEQVRPADAHAYEPAGAVFLDPDGEGATTGGPPGPGRPDTLEGAVGGVPEAVERRFQGKFFSERELRQMGARQFPFGWQIELDGADYVLEVSVQ
ncbi:MAG: hypothetical protein HY690_15540 [Chloroflexi bacterium]|nr:hypothetical protein [Chloroflexota bacterium]